MEKEKAPELGLFSVVAGEIFINYTGERFPFLLGREGSFDLKDACLSVVREKTDDR